MRLQSIRFRFKGSIKVGLFNARNAQAAISVAPLISSLAIYAQLGIRLMLNVKLFYSFVINLESACQECLLY